MISSLVLGLHQTKPRLAPRQAVFSMNAAHKENSHTKYLENCAVPLGLKLPYGTKLTVVQIFMLHCMITVISRP